MDLDKIIEWILCQSIVAALRYNIHDDRFLPIFTVQVDHGSNKK